MARETAGLKGRVERGKYIRRVVGDPQSVAQRMTLVLNAHREIDVQCRAQAEAAGMCVENLTVADIGYPLITRRVISRVCFNNNFSMCITAVYQMIQFSYHMSW
jgi:hypothetical protein